VIDKRVTNQERALASALLNIVGNQPSWPLELQPSLPVPGLTSSGPSSSSSSLDNALFMQLHRGVASGGGLLHNNNNNNNNNNGLNSLTLADRLQRAQQQLDLQVFFWFCFE
jgi:hypothetical protein